MLIGLAGFAGAGKTTAIKHLRTLRDGKVVYLGQTVLDEIDKRGLERTAANEKLVREEIRAAEGPAALASRRVLEVGAAVRTGGIVFVDAIYLIDEFEVLRSCVPAAPATLLAIRASWKTREARLAGRSDRPLTADELESRDAYERQRLRTDRVFQEAQIIENEGTIDDFQRELARFFAEVRGISRS